MTKAEYMQKLQDKLDSFSKELREDILEDYKQHFAEGELQGKTDEEIIEELGNIEDMVRDLSESELKENIGCGLPGAEELQRVSLEEPGNATGMDAAEKGQNGACENEQETAGGESLAAGADNCFSYSGQYERIVLDGEEADIYLKPSEDEDIHVEYVNQLKNGQMKYEYYQYEENGAFHAGIRKRNGGQECRTGVEGDERSWRVMLFGKTVVSYRNVGDITNGRVLALCVRVPKGVPEISARSSAGDVQVQDLVQENAQLESSSGDVKVQKTLANTMRLCASSGDVVVFETKCCRLLEASASSGDVKIQNVVMKEEKSTVFAGNDQNGGERELIAGSSSGDVVIQNVTAEKINAGSSSGDVNMQNVTAITANVSSSSGDVQVNNVNCSGELQVESSSGDLSVMGVEANIFNAETSGGDVAIAKAKFATGSVETSRGDLAMADMRFTTGGFATDAGDMALANLQFETGKFSARQGDIAVAETKFQAGSFATESGDIAGSNLSGEFGSFSAVRGDIVLRDQNGNRCRGYQCVTEGGDISIESAAEIYECRASSGDVSVRAYENPRKLTIVSASGDVSASAKGTPESVELQSSNGDVRLKLEETEGMDVDVNVGWGDASIKWDGQKKNVKKGSYTYGNGACKVYVSSKRGDVAVSGFSG